MPLGADALWDARVGGTQLFFTVVEGSAEQVTALLAGRVDPNVRDYEERCPLHVASGRGNLPVMKVLIEHGADVNAADMWGQTPLSMCERAHHHGGERMLKASGAKRQRAGMQRQAICEKWELNRSDIRIVSELSHTLKSSVHRATWNGVEVVVKCPGLTVSAADPDGELEEEGEAELLHEIALLATVRHPDLVMFLGCCLQESPIMIVMEYMPGGDLERHYRAKATSESATRWAADVKTVNRWARGILRALNFLHNCSEPIVHRDLKPLNILLTADLRVKVTDFGISRTVSRRHSTKGSLHVHQVSSINTTMTRGVGTWRYMAPEVARGEAYTEKIDIYAWALILYFMSSGLQPFHAYSDLERLLDDFTAGKEPRPNASQCPARFRPTMERAWHVEPMKRPSAGALMTHMEEECLSSACSCS